MKEGKKKTAAQQKNKQNPRIHSEMQLIYEWKIFKMLASMKEESSGSLSNILGAGPYQNSIIFTYFLRSRKAFFFLSNQNQDFPGGPLVKTLCCQCKGYKFKTWSGN